MLRKRRCTYATTYNTCFELDRSRLNKWVQRRLLYGERLSTRVRFCTHIDTLARTQNMSHKLSHDTHTLIQRMKRVLQAAIMLHLRRLQRRILHHLWRPGGTLMIQTMQKWITPTPDVGT